MLNFNYEQIFKQRQKNSAYLFAKKDGKKFLKIFNKYKNNLNKQQLAKNINLLKPKQVEKITKQQALEDLEQYKFLLKWCYIGYHYFGEKNYLKAFEIVKSEINKHEEVECEYFINLIISTLQKCGIYLDRHFYLQHKNTCARLLPFELREKTFCNIEYDIIKKGNDYFIKLENKLHKIILINNIPAKNCVRKIISKNGDLSLGIIIKSFKKIKNVQIECEDICLNAQLIQIGCQLKNFKEEDEAFLTKQETADYTYLYSTRFFGEEEEQKQAKKLIDGIGKSNKDVVFNLTVNDGGSDYYCSLLAQNLGMVTSGGVLNSLDLSSRVDYCEETTKYINSFYSAYKKSVANNLPNIKVCRLYEGKPAVHDCERKIVVLQSRFAASAGEAFAEMFHNHKNVVFVGDNTSGCVSFGNCRDFYLHNSGACAYFGTSLFTVPTSQLLEGKGFEPDIYIASEYADEFVNIFEKFLAKQKTLQMGVMPC